MEAARRFGDLLIGSWTRFVVAGTLIVAFWLAFAWLATTGRLADLRYVDLPFRPYPPAGYVQNPFNPADKGDLIDAKEAARVGADFLLNGGIELLASERGDVELLKQADTGRALDALAALIARNNAQGIYERGENRVESVVVGRLPDPNDRHIAWAVRERGTATLSYYSKAAGTLVRRENIRAESTFWLQRVGDRYLIADALVHTEPLAR